MIIHFRLAWMKRGVPSRRGFKLPGTRSLFDEYVERISKFVPCQVSGIISEEERKKPGTKIWICDRGTEAKELSSEQLSAELERCRDSGVRELEIAIGGPDGFSKKELEELEPDLCWSFGPLTLPHELAAVIASEQIYRAWTMIRGMRYHLGH